MQRVDLLEKTMMLGKIEGKRRMERQIDEIDSITNSMDMNLHKLQETLKDRGSWSPWGRKESDQT